MLTSLGKSVSGLLQDNYRSIEISKQMLTALESENSGVLAVMTGDVDEGIAQLNSGLELFDAGIKAAVGNLTLSGEKESVDSIRASHQKLAMVLLLVVQLAYWLRPTMFWLSQKR